ncbi:MAG: hypothetical protein ACJ8F3_05785 [Xanthobacteraceae bacterium]
MLHKLFAVLTVSLTIVSVTAVWPAEAARKQRQPRQEALQSLSLDGRNTGRPRTCGYDSYIYDSRGVPTGPYCH